MDITYFPAYSGVYYVKKMMRELRHQYIVAEDQEGPKMGIKQTGTH